MGSLLKPRTDRPKAVEVTPESAGWTYLDFAVVHLDPGGSYTEASGQREVVVVPISGSGTVRTGGATVDLARAGVFEELPHVLYVPPGHSMEQARGPYFHPDHTWIHDDWDAGAMTLPTAGAGKALAR